MATPLTKRKKSGQLYVRPADTERAVDEALRLPANSAIENSKIQDKSAPGYLRSECLVHLIREARRRGDEPTMNALIGWFFFRCNQILERKISDTLPNAEEIRYEILGRLSEYFALDGQKGDRCYLDYFECRFNKAFKALSVSEIRKAKTSASHITPLPESVNSESASDETKLASISKNGSTMADQLSALIVSEALAAMTKEDREAFLLVHRMGYKIESIDPNEETAATRAKVSGRTISTRLRRAEDTFKKYTEDTHD